MTTTTREISNSDDIIDSRDVIARIEELEAQIAELEDLRGAETLNEDERREMEDLAVSVADNAAELATLRELAEQGETLADWIYGETLIRDSYFVTYAQEYADDIVEGMRDAQWPFTHIDWEAAADDLQTDYTDIEYDGVTYWAR